MKVWKAINLKLLCFPICVLALYCHSFAAELGSFRLLSVSESEKLILVSQIPGKKKYLLDMSSAKITIDGKPAEYKSLKAFSTIQLKMEVRKLDKLGIELDGVATEILVQTKEEVK